VTVFKTILVWSYWSYWTRRYVLLLYLTDNLLYVNYTKARLKQIVVYFMSKWYNVDKQFSKARRNCAIWRI